MFPDYQVINWITYYLARGYDETQLRAMWTNKFGAIGDQQWANDFRGAAYAESNAANFQYANPQQRLKNLLKGLPAGQTTVTIRALATFESVDPFTSETVQEYGVYSAVFDLTETVAGVYAGLTQIAQGQGSPKYGTLTMLTVIPGIYLP